MPGDRDPERRLREELLLAGLEARKTVVCVLTGLAAGAWATMELPLPWGPLLGSSVVALALIVAFFIRRK